jgi:hypothetical protein
MAGMGKRFMKVISYTVIFHNIKALTDCQIKLFNKVCHVTCVTVLK